MEQGYSINRKKKAPEIVLAPMIDMVFLLLIFFMLTTTLVQNTGIEIKKPKAVSSILLPRKNIIVTVTADGSVLLEGKRLPWDAFRRELAGMITKSPDRMVVLNTDKGVLVGRIIDIMDEAKKNGAESLSIATEYETGEE